MNNLINKTAFEKMQSIKKIYLDKRYIFSGSDLLCGNYGARIFLMKNCKKYIHHVTIMYNISYSVDDILVIKEKTYYGRSIDIKKEYIPIN